MRLRAPGLHPQRVDGLPRVHYYAVLKKNVVSPTVAKVIEIAQAVCDFDAQEQQGSQWVPPYRRPRQKHLRPARAMRR